MAPLKSIKRERFCHKIIEAAKLGLTQAQALEASGYKAKGNAANVSASRIMQEPEIQNRIAELTAPALKKTRATVDTLAEQFDAIYAGAMGSSQFGAAGQAAGLKSKLLGFMRDRLEVGGVGDFDTCASPADVVEKMLQSVSADDLIATLDALKARLLEKAALNAKAIQRPSQAQQSASSEYAANMQLYHPTKSWRR